MNLKALKSSIAFIALFFFGTLSQAQSFGYKASAIWLSDCNQSNYFNTSGAKGALIGPGENEFSNASLGVHTQNSGTLILRGAEIRSFKNEGTVNVCAAQMYYRVYATGATPGAFTSIDLPFTDDCNATSAQFPSGGSCSAGDQKWKRIIEDGTSSPYAPVNLTSYPAGNYILEVYYAIKGSSTSATECNETTLLNNGGSNYKAFYSVQAPTLASSNPTSCNGSEGSVTIKGLKAGLSYTVSYADDGVQVAPQNFIANLSGEVVISNLNAGVYSDFMLVINGCTTEFNTDLVLSAFVITPRFQAITPICAGAAAPTLPSTSTNGIIGTWSPAIVNNMASGTYTFTPNAGQCAKKASLNVTVNPMITPVFAFGSSLTICAGAVVPVLSSTSTNGITGSWNPAVVDNSASASYTFIPSAGQCATAASFAVTVKPNITPAFDFGNSLKICAGGSVPALPATSTNGVGGSWSPAIVDNQSSATYTFTPTEGQCGLIITFKVEVMPNTIPSFPFGTSLTICENAAVPELSETSTNGISGTWSPATVSSKASGNYTFTPAPGQCATTTSFSVTVNMIKNPVFDFGSALSICAGASVPTLPTTSGNGIDGSWSPAMVNNQTSATYTFTPSAGQCATNATYTVTVNSKVTPSFDFASSLTICKGGSVPPLPPTSKNGVTGTWMPSAIDNLASGFYTFTPNGDQCAEAFQLNVTIASNVTPTFSFGTSLTICAGAAVPNLPATSDNGVNGTWSPAAINNLSSATYTFTPNAAEGTCFTSTSFTVTVNPNVTPLFDFGTSMSICAGAAIPNLPSTSTNGITGTWNPAIVDNAASATYTFTPSGDQCATTASFAVTVNEIVNPLFSFGKSLTICSGASVPSLPATSSNGVTGSWSPSVVDNRYSATYTFTPSSGQCAIATTFEVTVNDNVIPEFNIGSALTICSGDAVPALPTTSANGIDGTWSPSIVDNTTSASYTFWPAAGICATPVTFAVTVKEIVTPVFDFGNAVTICAGNAGPVLTEKANNGVTGTWSPSEVDNHTSGTYNFTPAAGQCATSVTLTVTVNENVIAEFDFGTSLTICAGGNVPVLPNTSVNGINGTWSPALIDNNASNVYTFTPAAGECGIAASFSVTVKANTVPEFDFGTALTICTGGVVPPLTTKSNNNITGTWSPALVDSLASGTYIFTPDVIRGECINPTSLMVTVNPKITPVFDFGTASIICAGASVPLLPATSVNGISGSWVPAIVDNRKSGIYKFTATDGQCAVSEITFEVTVNPVPEINNARADTTVKDGTIIPVFNPLSVLAETKYNWTASNPTIGITSSGNNFIPSFTAVNKSDKTLSATITVTPTLNGCTGAPVSYVINVLPLDKDVFVPNVFSPNGDGKNDVLMVYGNYIKQIEMRIFNQWGQQVALIDNPAKGWDGKYKGKPQTVGVYVYAMEAVMTDGRKVKGKGSITLLR